MITCTESDIQLSYGKSSRDLDFTLIGRSKVNGDGIHNFKGLASIQRKSGELFGEGNIDYKHKPSSKPKFSRHVILVYILFDILQTLMSISE